jgi:hypothetical protein
MNVTSTTLARAATLAGQIEALRNELNSVVSTMNAKVDELNQQIAPLETELNGLIAFPTADKPAYKNTGRQFTDEQKARISAGLKAKWAERKAAAAQAVPVQVIPDSTVVNTTVS